MKVRIFSLFSSLLLYIYIHIHTKTHSNTHILGSLRPCGLKIKYTNIAYFLILKIFRGSWVVQAAHLRTDSWFWLKSWISWSWFHGYEIETHYLQYNVKKKWWSKHVCHLPNLWRRAFSLSPLSIMLAVEFSIDVLYQIEKFLSISTLFCIFIKREC